MLRKPDGLQSHVTGPGDSNQLVWRSIETDHDANEPNWRVKKRRSMASGQSILSGSEQSRIYHDWVEGGKPHHFVCSECRLPEKLIGCTTCCRSYHASCLSLPGNQMAGYFYCSACKEQAWDRVPPSPPPPLLSQPLTPDTRGAPRENTPDSSESLFSKTNHRAGDGHPPTSQSPPMVSRRPMSGIPSMQTDAYEHGPLLQQPAPISDLYPHLLAYLSDSRPPRSSSAASAVQPEFFYQLDLMMREVQAYRALLDKTATLREEFARVQTENIQLRTYLNARLPLQEPTFSGASTCVSTPRPLPETSGRSWDSIVLDIM
ncbi:Zinc finger PHD-finger [Penicillium macrosclerotiorum]|uniref:Zinc finger PHD-finger n=1 Tax=Penicillium macrosclerotiorum TaxID=303699 RepID=UPI0025480421|nr:Zinc finger PHD-finger [Penicillium macrosclerotiorum]KAJ5679916.1 Zinc finger PHD-finger [Penicillium macrosclerotiorum]